MVFESCFPLKDIKIKYDNRAPYLKHVLWEKFEKNPTVENKNIYLQFRNKLTGLLRKTERLSRRAARSISVRYG